LYGTDQPDANEQAEMGSEWYALTTMKLLILWLVLACAKQNGIPVGGTDVPAKEGIAASTGAGTSDGTVPESALRCFEECTQANMARAVAWEMIEADCMKACGLEAPPDATLDIRAPATEGGGR